MRPLSLIGWILIAAGAVVLLMRGISYTRERQSVEFGGVEIAAERKGFVPPVAGALAIVAGAVLLVAARKRT
jgi:hypothetical protein